MHRKRTAHGINYHTTHFTRWKKHFIQQYKLNLQIVETDTK